MAKFLRFPLIVVLLALSAGSPLAAEIYVSPTGTGVGSKANPTNLQAALAIAAANGGLDDTIYLRQGTYNADPGTFTYDVTPDSADANAAVALSGGWSAGFAAQSADRSLTVLHGGDARRVLLIQAARAERSVVFSLERLTIRNGYATEIGGAGILGRTWTGAYGQSGTLDLTLRDCAFSANHAVASTLSGGAILTAGSLDAAGCLFEANEAGAAGAVDVQIPDAGSSPEAEALHNHTIPATFTDCEFKDNRGDGSAGPTVLRSWGNTLFMEGCLVHQTFAGSAGLTDTIQAVEGPVTMSGCVFRNNRVDQWGSAVRLLGSAAEISNCLFENNWAGAGGVVGGGAIAGENFNPTGHPAGAETVTVTNSTFVGNKGLNGDYGVLDLRDPQTATFTNCILRGNEAPAVYPASYATLSYSDIEGGAAPNGFLEPGGHNIDADALFVAGDPLYHLQSGSPCVDLGDNEAPILPGEDFEGDPRVFAYTVRATPVVDLGWDEYYDGDVDLTSPVDGAVWLNGSQRTISFTCANVGESVNLSLWKGPREDAAFIQEIRYSVACSAGSVLWTVPDELDDGADYSVLIFPWDYSSEIESRSIAIQHLRLKSPNGGNGLRQGSRYAITWESGALGGALVRIDLYSGNVLSRTIAAAAPNTGSFSWKVPFSLRPGSIYRIRLSTTSPYVSADSSNANFTILPAVTLTAPNGGQRWKRGLRYKIAWSFRNRPGSYVRLDLYKGTTLNRTIAARTSIGTGAASGTGYLYWTVPPTQATGRTFRVRVRSTAAAGCFDFSNKYFTIVK